MYEKSHSMYVQKNGIKLIDVINSMIEQKYKLNIIADRQYKTLKQHTKRIKENKIANMQVQKINSSDIQEFLYTIVNYSQSYIRKLVSLLNCAFTNAVNKQIIYSNPMNSVVVPKSKKDIKIVRALTFEEQKLFTEYLVNTTIYEENYKNVFLLQLYLGLRIGEVLALKNTDFSSNYDKVFVRRTITENKEGQLIMKNKTKTFAGKRDIKIPDYLRPFVSEQIELSKLNKDGLLFAYRNNYVRHHSVNSVLKRIFRTNLGLSDEGISTHILRHTFATRCREGNADPVVTRDLLGHSDIKETLGTYTEVQEDFKNSEFDKVNKYISENIEFKPKNR